MSESLPRPNVEIVTENNKDYIVISREEKGKKYEIEGYSENSKIKNVVEKIINDPYTGEWVEK